MSDQTDSALLDLLKVRHDNLQGAMSQLQTLMVNTENLRQAEQARQELLIQKQNLTRRLGKLRLEAGSLEETVAQGFDPQALADCQQQLSDFWRSISGQPAAATPAVVKQDLTPSVPALVSSLTRAHAEPGRQTTTSEGPPTKVTSEAPLEMVETGVELELNKHEPTSTDTSQSVSLQPATILLLHEADDGEGLFDDLFSGAQDLGATPAGFVDTLCWDDEPLEVEVAQAMAADAYQVDPFVEHVSGDQSVSGADQTALDLGPHEIAVTNARVAASLPDETPPPLDFPVAQAGPGQTHSTAAKAEEIGAIKKLTKLFASSRATKSKVVRSFIGIFWLTVGVWPVIFAGPAPINAALVPPSASVQMTDPPIKTEWPPPQADLQPGFETIEPVPNSDKSSSVRQSVTADLAVDLVSSDGPEPGLIETKRLQSPGEMAAVIALPSLKIDPPPPLPNAAETAPLNPAKLYLNGEDAAIEVEETTTEPVEIDGETYLRWQVPRYNAGHHVGTAAFGQAGNSTIVGHSIWYGETGAFYPLLNVQVGDEIKAVNGDGSTYTYRVKARWLSPYEDNSWLKAPDHPDEKWLTLYTCNLDLTALVVIQAELIGQEGDL